MLEEIKAEIERLKKEHQEPTFRGDEYEEGGVNGYQLALDKVLAKLDTLKEQPVELKEEIDKYISERWKLNGINPTTPVYLYDFAISDLKECARHFYNLGRGSSEKPNDLVSELKHHLATTPKEQLQKEWDELKKWDNIGPTVQEFLHGKQEKSEIPTNLDEAANEYAETHFRREYFQVPKDGMRRAFKAGWCAHDAQISKRSDNLDEAAENLDGFNDEQDKAASIYTDSLLEKLKIDGSIITPLSVYDAFKAGAMWQKDKDTRDMYMSDNRHFQKIYELGRKEEREQMMKEAVEGHVSTNGMGNKYLFPNYNDDFKDISDGDKVRIIIVKED